MYQLLKQDEPLMNEALRDFYVGRDDSPVDELVNVLALDDTDAKFLLAGWREDDGVAAVAASVCGGLYGGLGGYGCGVG